jgi:hypothetical protein
MVGERPSSNVELANQIRARRDAEVEAELRSQVDELGVNLAARRAATAPVELATVPAIQDRVPDQPIADRANVVLDHAVDIVSAIAVGDVAGREAALARLTAAARAPVSPPSDPSQYKPAPTPATASHPLISTQSLPTTDAHQPRSVGGIHPRIGGGPLQAGPG